MSDTCGHEDILKAAYKLAEAVEATMSAMDRGHAYGAERSINAQKEALLDFRAAKIIYEERKMDDNLGD